jgi:hypothetical protein
MAPQSITGETGKKSPPITNGEKDRILERHAASVNGHDLAKCEGWEGPLTPEERQRGVSPTYRFWARARTVGAR